MPKLRHVAAVAVGNAVEFYDFVTHAFFAVPIGRSLFPSGSPTANPLASLATFGAEFLLTARRSRDRPPGRPARPPVLLFALVGAGVAGLALTPFHARIGPAAPVRAVGFRMLPGFALGGEVGGSTAFPIEAAPPRRRGLYTALQVASAGAAVLVAGLVGVVLADVLTPAQPDDWIWLRGYDAGCGRGAIRAGAAVPTGGNAEPLPGNRGAVTRAGLLRIVTLGTVLLASNTIGNYALDYLTTHAFTMLARLAFGATVAVGLAGVIGDWLSDR